jgi:transporter family-2 protein
LVNSLYLALATLVGAGLAVQAGVNAQLRVAAGSALWAAMLSAAVTVILLSAAQLAVRDPLNVSDLPRYPWWIWIGGIMGAAYVFAIAAFTRSLGVAALFIAIVTGQLIGGMLIDHFGWFNAPVQRITVTRFVGALLLLAGMGMIRMK